MSNYIFLLPAAIALLSLCRRPPTCATRGVRRIFAFAFKVSERRGGNGAGGILGLLRFDQGFRRGRVRKGAVVRRGSIILRLLPEVTSTGVSFFLYGEVKKTGNVVSPGT